MIVRKFTIRLHIYAREIVGRISYIDDAGNIEESALYPVAEISDVVANWRAGALLGSFAIGAELAPDAVFDMVQR